MSDPLVDRQSLSGDKSMSSQSNGSTHANIVADDASEAIRLGSHDVIERRVQTCSGRPTLNMSGFGSPTLVGVPPSALHCRSSGWPYERQSLEAGPGEQGSA